MDPQPRYNNNNNNQRYNNRGGRGRGRGNRGGRGRGGGGHRGGRYHNQRSNQYNNGHDSRPFKRQRSNNNYNNAKGFDTDFQCEWYFKPSYLENPWSDLETFYQLESELVPFEVREVVGDEQVVGDYENNEEPGGSGSMEMPVDESNNTATTTNDEEIALDLDDI